MAYEIQKNVMKRANQTQPLPVRFESIFLSSDPALIDNFFAHLSCLESPRKEQVFIECVLANTLALEALAH